jgi:molecular chaperone Hsp33
MSELHKLLFDALPVRGVLVRLTDAWQEVLRRRASNAHLGAYPEPVQRLLGEMTAAAVLLQANIKFNGALVLQVQGDGPVKLAVVEVQSDLALRATASVQGAVDAQADLAQLVNAGGQGRCALTLDPQDRQPGQQAYQGVVPLADAQDQAFTQVGQALQHYMRQSEQLDTTLVLAADAQTAAGLLIQRLPLLGDANLAGSHVQPDDDDAHERALEDYQRIALLAKSLKREELLGLDADNLLHRLFWQEPLLRFEPVQGEHGPRFACTCSRQRVATMLVNLGQAEVHSILQEHGVVEVGCDFCAAQYRFDAVDVVQLFAPSQDQPPASQVVQ